MDVCVHLLFTVCTLNELKAEVEIAPTALAIKHKRRDHLGTGAEGSTALNFAIELGCCGF
jgi:hypothetical protein